MTKRVCKTPTGAEAMGFMGREAFDVTEIGGLTTAVRHETMLECHREHEKELDGEHALYLRERDEKRKLGKEKRKLEKDLEKAINKAKKYRYLNAVNHNKLVDAKLAPLWIYNPFVEVPRRKKGVEEAGSSAGVVEAAAASVVPDGTGTIKDNKLND